MGTHESIAKKPSVFSEPYLARVRSESKEKLQPKCKLQLKNPLERIREKRSTWQVPGPLCEMVRGMARHSGNYLDDAPTTTLSTAETPLFKKGTKPNFELKLITDEDPALEFILQNCTQTLSRTDEEEPDLYLSQGHSTLDPSDRATPGTAHFKMLSQKKSLMELSVSNIESDSVSRRISFDTTRSFQPPHNDTSLSYLMDSIDELYQKIVLVPNPRPLNEMPKDATSTHRMSHCSSSAEVFPEEQWLAKLEERKIEAMLDRPAAKATLILPSELRSPGPQYWKIRGHGKRAKKH